MPIKTEIVLDTTEYKRALDEAVAATRSASAKIKSAGGGSSAGGGASNSAAPKTPDPPTGKWRLFNTTLSQTSTACKGAATAVGNLVGGFTKAVGVAGLIVGTIQSIISIFGTVREMLSESETMAKDTAERNLAEIREAAQRYEAASRKADGYLNTLQQISAANQTSASSMAQAREALENLTAAYGDLGVRIDKTTGQIAGLDSAMLKKTERDKKQREIALRREIKQLNSSIALMSKERDDAGFLGIGGGETRLAAQAKIDEYVKRLTEVKRLLRESEKSDPVGQLRRRQRAAADDAEKAARDKLREQAESHRMDRIGSMKDPARQIQALQRELQRYRSETLDPLWEKRSAARRNLESAYFEPDKTEARRNFAAIDARYTAALQKGYEYEKRIAELRRTQAEREKEKQKAFDDYQDFSRKNLRYALWRAQGRDHLIEMDQALEAARNAKGGDLSFEENDAVVRQVKLMRKLRNRDNFPDFGSGDRQTNSLTARGGFVSGVKRPDIDRVNVAIRDYNRQTAETVKATLQLLKDMNAM